MSIQTTYQENLDAPRAGTQSGCDGNVDTGVAETAAGIGFGLAVSQGSVSDAGVILGGTVAGFRGISLRDVTLNHATADKYAQYDNVGVLTRGKVWVVTAEAVAAGNDVYFDGTTGALGDTNGSGKLGPLLGARWVTSAGSGEPALVELSGYNQS